MSIRYKLGEICEIVSGSTPKTGIPEYWDGDIKWITPAEISDDSYIIEDSVRHITELGVQKTGLTPFPKGTVILSSRAPIGKVAIAGCEMYCNQGFKNLICSEAIDNRYLYWFLKGNTKYLNSIGRGATFKEISKQIVSGIEINVPDMEIQNDAVEVLEKVSGIIRHRKMELKTLDALIKARFAEMFANTGASWPLVTIGDICTDTRTGPFGSALHHDEFVDDGIFVLGIDNAVENKFSYNRMRYITEEKYQQLKRYTVHPGDVIITIMGTIGRSAVIPEDMPLAINTKHLACLTPEYSKVGSVFLCSAFQMQPEIQRQLTGNAKGAIMDGLNLGIIKALKFQLPPIQVQKEFEAFFQQADKSKIAVQKALNEAQLLFDSLMQQYFG
mgnify:CR=1 FL=1